MKPNDSKEVSAFLHDLKGVLGGHLLGALIFGSHANGTARDDSDIDLAIILYDTGAGEAQKEVFRAFSGSKLNSGNVSLSVETYSRLRDFLRLGDPFAWVVCCNGIILKDCDELLNGLQQECRSVSSNREVAPIVSYLQSKSRLHYAQALQSLWQCLSNLQLCTMAAAQAAVLQRATGTVRDEELLPLSDWKHLKESLQTTSATSQQVEAVEELILAHKRARGNSSEYLGKEIVNCLRTAGELWEDLLPGFKKS